MNNGESPHRVACALRQAKSFVEKPFGARRAPVTAVTVRLSHSPEMRIERKYRERGRLGHACARDARRRACVRAADYFLLPIPSMLSFHFSAAGRRGARFADIVYHEPTSIDDAAAGRRLRFDLLRCMIDEMRRHYSTFASLIDSFLDKPSFYARS